MRGRCSLTGPGAAMSAPLHAALTPDQRQALRDLRHDSELRPRVRLRGEALLLSAGGMKVPQLAAHLDCCEATVRTLLHRFAAQGLAAIRSRPAFRPTWRAGSGLRKFWTACWAGRRPGL